MICHSEKQSATPTYKKTFGYRPSFCFLDGKREALSGMLREGRAGSNTTADHITVLDASLAQIPDAPRYGIPILIRSDSAGCTHGFLAHIRSLRGDRHRHPIRRRRGDHRAHPLFLANAAVFALFLFLAYYFERVLGYSPIMTGVAFCRRWWQSPWSPR